MISINVRNLTYEELIPKLKKRQRDVFDVIYVDEKTTLYHIARQLHTEKGAISGRVTELKAMQAIEECGVWIHEYKNSITGKLMKQPYTVYKVTIKKQVELFQSEMFTKSL
jgi:hypothetical protein